MGRIVNGFSFAGSSGGAAPLPLDNVTSAVLAFSVARKLKTGVSSPFRSRRSSDDAEQDAAFDGNNLDSASILTFAGAGDAFIPRLYEQTGNAAAVDFLQSVAANQPRIVGSGTLDTTDGFPESKNDVTGALEFLEITSWNTRPSSAVILAVLRRGTATVNAWANSGFTVYAAYAGNGQSSPILQSNAGAGQTIDINGALAATDGVTTRDVHYDAQPATGLFLQTIRGVDFSNAGWAEIRTARPLNGSTSGYGGVVEFIVLDNPSSGEVDTLEANMADYYGITLP